MKTGNYVWPVVGWLLLGVMLPLKSHAATPTDKWPEAFAGSPWVHAYVQLQVWLAEHPDYADQPYESLKILLAVYPFEPYLKPGSRQQEALNRSIAYRLMRLEAPHIRVYFHQRAYNGFLESGTSDPERRYYLANELAAAYFELKNYEKASQVYRTTLRQLAPDDTFGLAGVANNLGIIAYQQGKLDSAKQYFERSLNWIVPQEQRSPSPHNRDLIFALHDNLGLLAMDKTQWPAAEAHFRKNLGSQKDYRIYPARQAQAYLRLAELYLAQRRTSEANPWLNKAEAYIDTAVATVRDATLAWLLELQLEASRAPNAPYPMQVLLKRYINLRDQQQQSRRAGSEATFERLVSIQKQQLQQARRLEALAREQNTRDVVQWRLTLALVVLGALLVLLVAGGVVYTRNQRLRKARQVEYEKRKRLELERNLLETKAEEERLAAKNLELELRMREKDVQVAAQFFALQGKLTETFLQKLDSMQDIQQLPELKKRVSAAKRELKALQPTEEKAQAMATQLATVNAAFKGALQERYPNLSGNDLEMCSLIRLGLGTQEQALIRGVSEAGIRKARYRLSKRLGLASAYDLDAFIRSL